jgi:hypothetical protein
MILFLVSLIPSFISAIYERSEIVLTFIVTFSLSSPHTALVIFFRRISAFYVAEESELAIFGNPLCAGLLNVNEE